jgi:hypothetical protein
LTTELIGQSGDAAITRSKSAIGNKVGAAISKYQ